MTSEARLIANLLTIFVGLSVVGGACGFAVIKGGPAERIGAGVFVLSNVVFLAFQILTNSDFPIVQEVLVDFAVAFTFLVLAIRYNSLWLGAAMMVMGAQFSLHAAHLMDLGDPHLGRLNLYAFALNMIGLALCGILVGATLATLRKRRQARMASAEPSGRSEPSPVHGAGALNGG